MLGHTQGHIGQGTLLVVQKIPSGQYLTGVLACMQKFKRQRLRDAGAIAARDRAVFDQQAQSFQSHRVFALHTGHPKAQSQRQGAPGSALGQAL